MQCPKCGKEECVYVEQRKKTGSAGNKSNKILESRTDFRAKCKYCGWEGDC